MAVAEQFTDKLDSDLVIHDDGVAGENEDASEMEGDEGHNKDNIRVRVLYCH